MEEKGGGRRRKEEVGSIKAETSKLQVQVVSNGIACGGR